MQQQTFYRVEVSYQNVKNYVVSVPILCQVSALINMLNNFKVFQGKPLGVQQFGKLCPHNTLIKDLITLESSKIQFSDQQNLEKRAFPIPEVLLIKVTVAQTGSSLDLQVDAKTTVGELASGLSEQNLVKIKSTDDVGFESELQNLFHYDPNTQIQFIVNEHCQRLTLYQGEEARKRKIPIKRFHLTNIEGRNLEVPELTFFNIYKQCVALNLVQCPVTQFMLQQGPIQARDDSTLANFQLNQPIDIFINGVRYQNGAMQLEQNINHIEQEVAIPEEKIMITVVHEDGGQKKSWIVPVHKHEHLSELETKVQQLLNIPDMQSVDLVITYKELRIAGDRLLMTPTQLNMQSGEEVQVKTHYCGG